MKRPIPLPALKLSPASVRWLSIAAWALGLVITLGLEAGTGAIGLWWLAPGARFAFAAFGAAAILACAGLAWLIAALAPRQARAGKSGEETAK